MKLRTTLLAAAATMAIAPAAHAYEGLYGAIGAGLSLFGNGSNDISNDSVGAPGPFIFDTDADYDSGIGIYAAIGKAHGNGIRTELEYSYRNADINAINPYPGFAGIPSGSVAGDSRVHALMVNALYDFSDGGFAPYIGGGVGIGRVNHQISGVNGPAALAIAYGDTEYNLAFQGIAGVAIGLAEGLALDISYRYFNMLGNEYSGGAVNGSTSEIKAEAGSHNVFAGLRWNFGASTPPPVQYKDCWDGSSVPITAECPPQIIEEQAATLEPIGFTVYFDYDKANLTPQASTLIQEAASRALQNDIETVVVSGNTDTSGSSAYNQALSERRARVVREALVANGVSADRIRSEAYGESNLAKATADGVREPLNRRSEVVISFE